MTSNDGCLVISEVEINAYPIPEANFSTSPSVVDILNPEVTFNNLSTIENNENLSWTWNFGAGNPSHTKNPSYTYLSPGIYWVDLHVLSEHSCADSVSLSVQVDDYFQIYFPDALMINSRTDANSYFYPKGIGASEDNFHMYIYNRWGEIVFETTEFPKGFSQKEGIKGGWNGRYQNSGEYVQNGIYVYRVSIKDNSQIIREYTGTVTVIR